jgi:hypothetical protein
MVNLRDISAKVADTIAGTDIGWNLVSKTLVRWSQYICQSRREVESRRIIEHEPALHKIFREALVIKGPFAGMNYGRATSFCSAYFPKILGTYEMELIPAINAFLEKGYCHIVDVGAADGFYAVGFALKSPESKIIAYEQSPRARKQLGILARTNGVQDSIEIRERCERSDIMSLPSTPGLLIVDCEGYEEVLLDDPVIKHLKEWDFLIETHDGFSRGVTRKLIERFKPTHNVTIIDTIHDLDKADHYMPEAIQHLKRQDQDLLLSEQREHATLRWLLCHSKN